MPVVCKLAVMLWELALVTELGGAALSAVRCMEAQKSPKEILDFFLNWCNIYNVRAT